MLQPLCTGGGSSVLLGFLDIVHEGGQIFMVVKQILGLRLEHMLYKSRGRKEQNQDNVNLKTQTSYAISNPESKLLLHTEEPKLGGSMSEKQPVEHITQTFLEVTTFRRSSDQKL
ncbi:hypothetical protein NDU88_004843 [Pleurodeles waltl]|uniref:Uncharacterized protein n=1 Tax=Pleurodeles waltl TaxID=8319 RepID=A0AAV7L114_PLEWA|nr:hypothetical protein NDU88_004843 [Pleurodeles waltl]